MQTLPELAQEWTSVKCARQPLFEAEAVRVEESEKNISPYSHSRHSIATVSNTIRTENRMFWRLFSRIN